MPVVVEQVIAAPRKVVWDRLADLADHVSWMRDALSIEFLGDTTSGVGTRMAVRTRVGPFRTLDMLEVVDWDEMEMIGVAHRGVVSGEGRFTLVGDGPTTVVWSEELSFPWWLGGRITALIARPILRAVWRANLTRFAATFFPPN